VSATTGISPPPSPSLAGDRPVLVLTPMGVEARAPRAGAPWARVQRTGMGRARSERWAAAARGDLGARGDANAGRGGSPVLGARGDANAGRGGSPASAGARAVIIAGFCGALHEDLHPGDIVLASELRDPDGSAVATADPTILAGVLRRGGLRVHVGPIASSETVVRAAARHSLAQTGALAVDMESAWLAPAVHDRPLVALRVVLDTAQRELHRPLRTLGGFITAYRRLRRALALTEPWARALGDREILLASPRASCAGVDRAIEIVQAALAEWGAPIYVRRQIVHNTHVIAGLQARGAVFVQELDEVPVGSRVIFAAHGVSPEVRRAATERALEVIDATCPLVAKVHAEARRFDAEDFDIVLVGHVGHEEIEGTFGEAPERTQVIESVDDVAKLSVQDPARVAYLTQTTLAVDETAEVVQALRDRFPGAVGPPSSDICYATQNRQDAVRTLAAQSDIVIVVGSANSSNARRLVEVARRAGCASLLVENADELGATALAGRRRIGVSAGASAPESLVEDVVRAIAGVGGVNVTEHTVATEKMQFKLPPEVRPQRSQ
jgi:4-hydroxy-3-methylbut-2-enyl diphosphate reductase